MTAALLILLHLVALPLLVWCARIDEHERNRKP